MEATTLPTEPQPLPHRVMAAAHNESDYYYNLSGGRYFGAKMAEKWREETSSQSEGGEKNR